MNTDLLLAASLENDMEHAGKLLEISFQKATEAESKKTISFVYSNVLRKLYVRQQVLCPINCTFDNSDLPESTILKTMVVYSRPQDASEPVQRCMNHIVQEKASDLREYFLRCQHKYAKYETDAKTGKQSVSVPVSKLTEISGKQILTCYYMFMCFSSCSGTVNRRPTQLIFTLENESGIMAQKVIELRICACPGRDKALDENQLFTGKRRNKPNRHLSDCDSFGRRTSSDADISDGETDDEEYHFTVKGRKAYFQMKSMYQDLQDARKYRRYVRKDPTPIPNSADIIRPFPLNLSPIRNSAPIDKFLGDVGLTSLSDPLRLAGIFTTQDLTVLSPSEIEARSRVPAHIASMLQALSKQHNLPFSPGFLGMNLGIFGHADSPLSK